MKKIVLQLGLRYPLTTLHHLVKSVVAAQLKDYVNVLGILEDVVEQQDVLVL